MIWSFLLYYSVGFFVAHHAKDRDGKPPTLWHMPFIALVWPALFAVKYE